MTEKIFIKKQHNLIDFYIFFVILQSECNILTFQLLKEMTGNVYYIHYA